MSEHVAYIETNSGVFRETAGVCEGPFTHEELGLEGQAYIPRCQVLSAAGAYALLSFGFGYGVKADNRFQEPAR